MILLTGASGFIGSFLLDALIKKFSSDQIVCLTSKPIDKCQFLLHRNYIFGDEFFVNAGFSEIETIIHAGAFIPKVSTESNDIERCTSNIVNTAALINAQLPCLKKFIFLSTVDVYGHDNPITEKSPLNPVSLYGHSKLYSEKMISNWAYQNNISCQILRIGHVYGPGEEKYQKLIPLTMQRLLKGNNLQLYGSGNDIRTFIYITDVVTAIIRAMNLQSYAGVINIVGQEQITIFDLIHQIIKISKQKVLIENVKIKTAPRDLIFDNHKMKSLLHIPEIKLKEGLVAEWNHLKKLNL